MNRKIPELTEQDILDAVMASGYLMESRIIKQLDSAEFEISPNIVMLDSDTGKTREIDMVCYDRMVMTYMPDIFTTPTPFSLNLHTRFIIEAMNLQGPIILFTPCPQSLCNGSVFTAD